MVNFEVRKVQVVGGLLSFHFVAPPNVKERQVFYVISLQLLWSGNKQVNIDIGSVQLIEPCFESSLR